MIRRAGISQIAPAVLGIILCIGIASSCGGDKQDSSLMELGTPQAQMPEEALPGGSPELPWPPVEGNARQASDDEISLTGAEFSSAGGSYEATETTVILDGSEPISYATYSAGLFSSMLDFNALRTNYTLDFTGAEEDLKVYIGVANFRLKRWQWFGSTPGTSTLDIPAPEDCFSEAGNAHVALVAWGNGTATINNVTFLRVGPTNTEIPQNLRAEAFVHEIHLDWDPVQHVSYYNVYRATDPQFSSPVKINEIPVFDSSYVDETATTHIMWYYRVTAVHALESGMSNMVDIFSPRVLRPEPMNLRVTGRSLTSVTIEWDWPTSEADPYAWKIYMKGEKDFNLVPPIGIRNATPFARKATLDNLTPGETIYMRVVSMDEEGNMGRMTDDIDASPRRLYQWGDIEVLGPGTGPLDMMVVDGDLSAVYFENILVTLNGPFGEFDFIGGKIMMGRRDGGEWIIDDASYDEELGKANGIYGNYLDFAWGGEEYLIAAKSRIGDLITVFQGTPGNSWESEELSAGGLGLRVASNGSEFSISHLNPKTDSSPGQLLLHRKPVAAPVLQSEWETIVLREENTDVYLNYHSMDYDPLGNLSVMTLDLITGNLMVGHSTDNFDWNEVLAEDGTYLGSFNDMHYIDGNWFASAYRAADEKLFLLNDGSQPWQAEQVSFREIEAGNRSRLSSFQGRPMVLYYGTPPDDYLGIHQRWYFGLYEEEGWHTEWIQIEGYEFYDFGGEAELVDLNGQLYFMFEDKAEAHPHENGTIKVARAQAPEL